jgi:LysR family glycine cleavage system transcriptional activator
VAGVDCEGGVVFAHNAAIEAAVAGRGFALVRRALVQQELDRRELVSVQCKPLATPLAYHLVYRPEALIDPGLRRFREWIMAQRSAR